MLAEVKRIEVDERIEIDDERLASLSSTKWSNRDVIPLLSMKPLGAMNLAAIEIAEITVIQDFLPTALNEEEINAMIAVSHRRDRSRVHARYGQGNGTTPTTNSRASRRRRSEWPS